MSTPLREDTRSMCGEVREKGRIVSPRAESSAFVALETEVGRVKDMIFAGGIGGEVSVERRPSTMERPVWPVAPMIAIIGAMIDDL